MTAAFDVADEGLGDEIRLRRDASLGSRIEAPVPLRSMASFDA